MDSKNTLSNVITKLLFSFIGISLYSSEALAEININPPVFSEEEIKVDIKAPKHIPSRANKSVQYDRYFQLAGGMPVTEQNIDISTSIAEVQMPFAATGMVLVDWVGGVGTINTNVDTGTLTEMGLGLSTRRKSGLRLRIDGRVRYLEEHVFDEGIATKDYGGPVQFVSSLGADWQITKESLILGYRLEHMSNYNIYDSNPALNSHNLIMSFSF